MKKNMRGFTLMEMVVVIAMIVFLSAAVVTGVVQYVNRANERSEQIRQHNIEYGVGQSNADACLQGFSRDTKAPAATSNTSVIVTAPSGGGGGGGGAPAPVDPDPTPADPTPAAPAEPDPTPAVPAEPDPTPAAGGGVSAPGGFTQNNNDKGVASIVNSSDGKTQTVVIQNNVWNQAGFTITKNGSSYTLNFTSGNKYIVDSNVFKDLWKGDPYVLTPEQMAYLTNNYGLQFS